MEEARGMRVGGNTAAAGPVGVEVALKRSASYARVHRW